MEKGGILISDNVLQGGEVLESHYIVERRDRTIHKRMREYLTAISEDPRLRTVLLETGDGAALSVRRQNIAEPEAQTNGPKAQSAKAKEQTAEKGAQNAQSKEQTAEPEAQSAERSWKKV